jgi:hypothetical protein
MPLGRVLDAFVTDDPPVDAAPPRDLSSASEHRFWLLPELQERLEKAALGSSMMIAIDDPQWADTARPGRGEARLAVLTLLRSGLP